MFEYMYTDFHLLLYFIISSKNLEHAILNKVKMLVTVCL